MFLGQETWTGSQQGTGMQQQYQGGAPAAQPGQGQSQQQFAQFQAQQRPAAQQQFQQQQYQQPAQGQQQMQPQRPSTGAAGEVGQADTLVIAGCSHEVVGPIIRGEYQRAQLNHGKAAYKKEGGASGLVVMIYFWDERDGVANAGWWIGPQIGGNMVWGHHPNRSSQTPPTSGWQAPHSAAADPSMTVAPKQAGVGGKGAAAPSGMKGGKPGAGCVAGPGPSVHGGGKIGPKGAAGGMQGAFGAAAGAPAQGGAGKGGAGGAGAWGQQQQKGQWGQQQAGAWGQQQQSNAWQQEAGGKGSVAEQQQRREVDQEAAKARIAEQQQRKQAEQEAAQKRLAEQQHKMLEQKRVAEEAARVRAAAAMKQQAELKACTMIRKIIMKLRTANPENFEALKEELAQTLAKEFDSCGGQKAKVQEESDKALDVASAKVDGIKEARRRSEEKQKELELKRKEQQEAASKKLDELALLVEATEEATKAARTALETYTEGQHASEAAVRAASEPAECELNAALGKCKEAMEFIKSHSAQMRMVPGVMKVPPVKPVAEGDEEKEADKSSQDQPHSLPKLHARANAAKVLCDKDMRSFKATTFALVTKSKAMDEVANFNQKFAKYDKDTDGLLSRAEITAYAKTEYEFSVPKETLDLIFKVIVDKDGKGVSRPDFHRLTSAVGVARERAMDGDKRKAREVHEQQIASAKEELAKSVSAVAQSIKDAESDVKAFAERTKSLLVESRTMKALDMLSRSDDLETTHRAAVELVTSAKDGAAALDPDAAGVPKELTAWLRAEKLKLGNQIKSLETQLNACKASTTRFKEIGSRKDTEEVKVLVSQVMGRLRAHQTKGGKIANPDLFKEVSGGAADVTKEAFATFVQKLAKAEAEPEDQAAEIAADEIHRVFASIDEDSQGKLSQDAFAVIMRSFMKVIKDIAITDNMSMKDGKVLRRLDVGEVVEVIEGPLKDDKADVLRVKARTMQDTVEGWITMTGNQGSHFLKEGGGVFKVVKETILTDAFELDSKDGKEEADKVKQATRKLKVGEMLEVREWCRKQADTGLTRMKCKARQDGSVGWVTTVGNTGIKFVEVV